MNTRRGLYSYEALIAFGREHLRARTDWSIFQDQLSGWASLTQKKTPEGPFTFFCPMSADYAGRSRFAFAGVSRTQRPFMKRIVLTGSVTEPNYITQNGGFTIRTGPRNTVTEPS